MKTTLKISDFFISQKTNPIIKTLLVLFFVFIYFLIIWLLFGEFNLLKLYFIVYPGMINPNDSTQVATFAQIDSRLYYFLFIPGIVYTLIIFLLKLFKQNAWDMVSIFLATWMGWVALILSAALPSPYSILMLTVRLLIVALTFFGLFFITNFIIIKIVASPNYSKSVDTFIDYVNQETKINKINQSFKKILQDNQNLIFDVDSKNIFCHKKK
ncbi:hypothetical protein [Mycoplasmoides pirum]|uniref:hypothetical protein n=1 Tax=Mycoplasmoides pirum TaxID=2122 RepID=UPI0004826F61|nr:hypothetical protein [Mycoplasmoides pirum]